MNDNGAGKAPSVKSLTSDHSGVSSDERSCPKVGDLIIAVNGEDIVTGIKSPNDTAVKLTRGAGRPLTITYMKKPTRGGSLTSKMRSGFKSVGMAFKKEQEIDLSGAKHGIQEESPVEKGVDTDKDALANLRVGGLKKGDVVVTGMEQFPGAKIFRCMKLKMSDENVQRMSEIPSLPRIIIVTKDRLLVLQAIALDDGLPPPLLNSQATVKSNHHLSELSRMTLLKKDPDVVTLHYRDGPSEKDLRRRTYRVDCKDDFITTLQQCLQRFR
eukprot:CAMPEP_0185783696 /NCGR_PEP_ID=MMETSP1174-20130828/118523_1 /TAXON_ID=35687 /ORGANISM="Dictyocha speculum, Strain CCMP1381" /LENGTH=269 /DNA_ID=CAMNT_0028474875 /DNA_START=198 /DNA_END=1007 /DNA_ORIENTATION=-